MGYYTFRVYFVHLESTDVTQEGAKQLDIFSFVLRTYIGLPVKKEFTSFGYGAPPHTTFVNRRSSLRVVRRNTLRAR